jgi:hypothetical protein
MLIFNELINLDHGLLLNYVIIIFTFLFLFIFRVSFDAVVVNPVEHRGWRRQGPRLPSRRREARHLPRLQDLQHPTRPGIHIYLYELIYTLVFIQHPFNISK